METQISFSPYASRDDAALRFAVIAARTQGKWVFCRHRERKTWEIPGGHREPGEEILDTARRELYEETGAQDASVQPVCIYSVTVGGKTTSGLLAFAEIEQLGELPQSEIAEVRLFDRLPEELTYPQIQPYLFEKTSRWRTLCVSDLDGTLLNEQGELSNACIEGLNRFLDHGVRFTAATARTPATAVRLLENLHLTLPVILLNGAAVYNLKTKAYEQVTAIPAAACKALVAYLDKHCLSAFVYAVQDDQLVVYYREISHAFQQTFIDERTGTPYKTFVRTDSYTAAVGDSAVLNIALLETEALVEAFRQTVLTIPEVRSSHYRDLYSEDGWFLEVFSAKASKGHALRQLAEIIDAPCIASFGDAENDRTMFDVSTYCCVPENASQMMRDAAGEVIGSNREDGVLHWMEGYYGTDWC